MATFGVTHTEKSDSNTKVRLLITCVLWVSQINKFLLLSKHKPRGRAVLSFLREPTVPSKEQNQSLLCHHVLSNYYPSASIERNREQNTKIMKSIKSLVDNLSTRLKYYFNLVALVRTERDNEGRLNGIKTDIGLDNFNRELLNLDGDESDWHHGFNSGMLASTRLYRELIEYEDDVFENESGNDEVYPVERKWVDVINEFPFLDT